MLIYISFIKNIKGVDIMNKEEIKEEIKSFYTKKYNKKNEEIIKKINELQNILKENITEKRQVIYRPEQAFIMLKSTQNKDQEIMKIITLFCKYSVLIYLH